MKDKVNLFAALLKAQGELSHVGKNADNPYFNSKYADLPSVLDVVKPVLQENGLIYTHLSSMVDGQQVLSTYISHVESGEYIVSEVALQPTKRDPQGLGSAMTYARRYELCAMLGLAQADDDGNAASRKLTAKDIKERSMEIGAILEHATDLTDLSALWKKHYSELKGMGDAHLLFCEQIKDDMKNKLGE